MGVGGHEALLVIQVFALLLTLIPSIRRLLVQPVTPTKVSKNTNSSINKYIGHVRTSSLLALYALCLTGLCVWKVEDQFVRLMATATSCIGFAILYTIEWGRALETDQVDRKSSGELRHYN
jgi:hypothetical protein